MLHFKRHWDAQRGDQYSDWGTATYFFETDEAGDVKRQMEIYENGRVMKYDEAKPGDDFGGLAVHELDLQDFQPFLITEDEFTQAWNRP